METKTYYDVVPKAGWRDGPWMHEADKAQWQDKATGLPCLIVRGPHGSLCGYVGVPKGHPWYGEDYWPVEYDDEGKLVELSAELEALAHVAVHGGLTFADRCQPHANEATGICHVPGEGEDDDVWWLGFDCAHAGDLSPKIVATLDEIGHDRGVLEDYEVYRTFEYVMSECEKLAAQAKEVADAQRA